MLQEAVIPLLLRESERIAELTQSTPREKVLALATLLDRVFYEATKEEQIAFNTHFARICYAGQRFGFKAESLRRVHWFRYQVKRLRQGSPASDSLLVQGLHVFQESVQLLSVLPGSTLVQTPLDQHPAIVQESASIASLKVMALRDFPDQHFFTASSEEFPEKEIRVRYGVPDRNENFQHSIDILKRVFGFPASLNLLDIETDSQGYYLPRAFVLEPDYLMDVSAISECFKDTGPEPYAYLVRKFLPHETSDPILLGNIANYFLDRLLNEPEVPWQDLFMETFQLYPFVYAPMSNAQVKGISGKAQKHFVHIKQMSKSGFVPQGIDPENCLLEPAFFSTEYGIQGRLDLFYKDGQQSAIVELKSGTPFKPNRYGISRSHFTQTLLYDLLVRSVFGKKVDPLKYILYSGVDVNHLRFAPTINSEQLEAIQVRNQLVAIERLLTKIQAGDDAVAVINKMKSSKGQGFTARDYARFQKAYDGLSNLEKKYFNSFTGFIAREHWLTKVGEENSETSRGYASLWRNDLEDKILNFNILSHLEIVDNKADQAAQCIVFKKTERTNKLANFRVGDIAVLYPALSDSDTVLKHQIIKCTISSLDRDQVEVQLRFRQHNLKPFDTKGFWNLEPDMLDSGFVAMYRSLLEWAEAGTNLRQKVLGTNVKKPNTEIKHKSLIEKMALSPEFFLLWGPPGTGKTSVILRDLVDWIINNTSDNILLLAYTNRAVDEICEALESIGGNTGQQYIRVGGKHATASRFLGQLLSSKISAAQNRAEILNILEGHRIFVSTVASFSHNSDLLKLKKFQRLIVDEASQILEPQIIGLLTRFNHFTLIGDHRQLPAVTSQGLENTKVHDQDLNNMGMVDLRDSYFERLYLLCKKNQYHWAFDQLEVQGRMHEDIMGFPARYFYDGKLQVYNEIVQKESISYILPDLEPELGKLASQKRMFFLPVRSSETALSVQKTSIEEADLCTRIVLFYKELWKKNGKSWDPEKTLGIITPWRAQIAQISDALAASGLKPNDITIDTVERYQGGARDIILVSTCVHSEWQLSSLVNVSSEGIDRKLNVALTRARQQLIMMGNPDVLKQDERYRLFIEQYGVDGWS